MPKIEVSQSHALELAEVKTRMEGVQAELTEKHGLAFSWEGDRLLRVSGKGVKGNIRIEDSLVRVDLDLSMLLTPFKGKIESRLREQLRLNVEAKTDEQLSEKLK